MLIVRLECAVDAIKKGEFMRKKSIFQLMHTLDTTKKKKTKEPSLVKPMLATLTKNYFSDKNWLYEHKFDGERCLAFKHNGIVRLMSRNNKTINSEYPELVKAFEQQSADNFIVDGEIVAHTQQGTSGFELLQGRINLHDKANIIKKQKNIRIAYCIFDLLYADMHDTRSIPLYIRKALLKKLFHYNKLLVYTTHKIGNGISFFKKACAQHWEGLIAKRIDSPYVGNRSTDWLKFKCIMKQELIIVGYTDPQKSRNYFGALLVGYYEHGKLLFAGKVGTGFSQETLKMLSGKLQKLRIEKCPFAHYNTPNPAVHWVKPVLVAEFEFAEWTQSKKLRVGRYKGLRNDKNAKDVVREIPKRIGPNKVNDHSSSC
jgi:bifunctional non-homologous end joining protein LigD